MPRERETISEVRDLGVRLIAALARGRDQLRSHEFDVRRVEGRRDHAVGEDRPARVQGAAERAQPKERPVLGRVDRDDAAAARRRALERLAGVAPRSPLGRGEE
jgi:hypothetical protein